MIELSSKTVTEVQHGNYGPYLALGRKLPTNKMRWIFLPASAVQAIDIGKIEKCLKEGSDHRMQLHSNQHAVVSSYKNWHYVGFHRLTAGGDIIAGQGMNLNRDEWNKFSTHLPSLLIEVRSKMLMQYRRGTTWYFLPQGADEETRFVTMPTPTELMGMLYRWCARRNIDKEITNHCPGCRCDAPGQLAHMGPGGNCAPY